MKRVGPFPCWVGALLLRSSQSPHPFFFCEKKEGTESPPLAGQRDLVPRRIINCFATNSSRDPILDANFGDVKNKRGAIGFKPCRLGAVSRISHTDPTSVRYCVRSSLPSLISCLHNKSSGEATSMRMIAVSGLVGGR